MYRPLTRLTSFSTVARRRDPIKLHAVHIPPAKPVLDGNLPPLIFMHGMLASELTYRSIHKRDDFVPFREKIAIDLCNHGSSPRVSGDDMDYETMSSDVINLMDTLEIPRAALLGHSMGGKVAMHTALTHKDRVSELIVVDIAPITYIPGTNASDPPVAARAMAAIDVSTLKNRTEVNDLLIEQGVSSKTVRQFLMTNLTRAEDNDNNDNNNNNNNNNRGFKWKSDVHAILEAMPKLLTFPTYPSDLTYDGPTCFIRGGQSKYVPFNAMRRVITLFPKTKLVTISNAGHWVQAQMPDEFCRSVNDFLND